MIRPKSMTRWVTLSLIAVTLASGYLYAQQSTPQTVPPNPYLMGTEGLDQGPRGLTSYMPVAITESFASLMARLSAEKPAVEQAHNALLSERYDLSDRPAQDASVVVSLDASSATTCSIPSAAEMTWSIRWYSFASSADMK